MIPVLLGAAALWGAANISEANDKIRSANSINSQAAQLANSAKKLVETANNEMNDSLDRLGRTETNIMDGNIKNFVAMFKRIYDEFEYKKNYSGLQKLEQMGFKKKVIQEMQRLSNKFVEISSTQEFKQIEGNSFGAIGLLGAGALVGGLGVIAAPAALLYSFMKSDEAEAALYEAKTRMDEARLYEQQCKNLSALFSAINARGRMINNLLSDLNIYLSPAVRDMRQIISRCGLELDEYPEPEYLQIYYAYQITNTIKILIETPIVQNDWSINPMLDSSLEKAEKNIAYLKSVN